MKSSFSGGKLSIAITLRIDGLHRNLDIQSPNFTDKDRQAWFWATHSGAELDLLLLRNGRKIGFEFKYSDAPKTTKSMHSAVESLQLEKLLVVHPGEACYPLSEKIQVLSLSKTLRQV